MDLILRKTFCISIFLDCDLWYRTIRLICHRLIRQFA